MEGELFRGLAELDPLLFFAVFLASFGINLFAQLSIVKTIEKKALPAASFDTIVSLLAAFTVISFTGNPYYVLPEAIGVFVGSYVGTRFGSSNNNNHIACTICEKCPLKQSVEK